MRRKVTRNEIEENEITDLITEVIIRYPVLTVFCYFASDLTFILQHVVQMSLTAQELANKWRYKMPPQYKDVHDPTIRALMAVLEIPINVAEEVRVKIGSFMDVVNADDATLDAIKGVGIKTLEKIQSLRSS